MDKFRFVNWKVYQESQELFTFILKLVKKIPKEYRFELGSQVIRSSFSIILNIAEGSGKSSDKELNRFFEIALGSVYETMAATDTLLHNKFITQDEFANVVQKADSISKQIGGFKKKLDSKV